MIDWRTEEGQYALQFIKKEKEEAKSYRSIADSINEQKLLPNPITAEQVRNAKRYYIDKKTRVKSTKRSQAARLIDSKYISDETKAIMSLFEVKFPQIKRYDLVISNSKPRTTSRTEEMVLMLSGLNVDETSLNKKLNTITSEVKRLHFKQTASSKIDNLNLFMLGDMVVGHREHANQMFINDISTSRIDKMYLAVTKVAEMLINLLINVKKIHISAISNIGDKIGINWDILFYKALEKMLINYKDRIIFSISENNWLVKNLYGRRFLLVHESVLKDGGYLSTKALELVIEYGNTVGSFDYLCTANHHHDIYIRDIKEHLENGSFNKESNIKTGDNYQTLFGVDSEGIAWRYKIK